MWLDVYSYGDSFDVEVSDELEYEQPLCGGYVPPGDLRPDPGEAVVAKCDQLVQRARLEAVYSDLEGIKSDTTDGWGDFDQFVITALGERYPGVRIISRGRTEAAC
jgi:hypothetical protein